MDFTEDSARLERLDAFRDLIANKPADPSEALSKLARYKAFTDRQFSRVWGWAKQELSSAEAEIHRLQQLLQSPAPSSSTASAQRPDTRDTARGETLTRFLDLSTMPRNYTSAYDAITVNEAQRVVNQHRDKVVGPFGCWESNLIGRAGSGYQKVNLRNTMAQGQRLEVQIYLHQLTLIADNRRDELMVNARESEHAYECSHLCHNGRCFNPSHIIAEPRYENKERQTCNGQFIVKHRHDVQRLSTWLRHNETRLYAANFGTWRRISL